MGWFRADLCGARLLFTDRAGGVSTAPFATLNLAAEADGVHWGLVAENRRRALAALGVDWPWMPIRQVHGATVVAAHDLAVDGPSTEADAVVVTAPGRVGAILTADCAPIAVVGKQGGAVVIHAGWPGLMGGVIEAGVEALRHAGVEPGRAVLGPCVRPCCYEFGGDKLADFEARFGPGVRSTTSWGTFALDIPAAVRAALGNAGVSRVSDLGVCTSCAPEYFSYRRDGDPTGRQALLVAVLDR